MNVKMISDILEFRGIVEKNKNDGGKFYLITLENNQCESSQVFLTEQLVMELKNKGLKKGQLVTLSGNYNFTTGKFYADDVVAVKGA